jgi:hypothetical protein
LVHKSTLLTYLFKDKIDECDIVEKIRKGIPEFSKKLENGKVEVYSNSDIMTLKWSDKRDMYSNNSPWKLNAKDEENKSKNREIRHELYFYY